LGWIPIETGSHGILAGKARQAARQDSVFTGRECVGCNKAGTVSQLINSKFQAQNPKKNYGNSRLYKEYSLGI
jgi:hypothetical protein